MKITEHFDSSEFRCNCGKEGITTFKPYLPDWYERNALAPVLKVLIDDNLIIEKRLDKFKKL